MKVLVGQFINEANANIPVLNETKDFDIAFGEECINKTEVREVFEKEGIEIIPSIYAVSGASGVIKRTTFDYIESCFTAAVKNHLNEIDGIYLMLHGASEVEGLGSGDHHILWEIRKIVGPYLPITVACDPHGNLCKEYTDQITAIRSYRESPHTDASATRKIMAQMLVDLLKNRQNIHCSYRKLPLILGGEQSVSADEPVKSINAYMDEMEKDPRIRSASWHVGYIRHDSPVAGCGVVVVPQTEADQEYAEQKVDELAKYVWDRHREFHYTGTTAQPDEALNMVLAQTEGPCSLTDSGDNTTSGATGWNTYVLRQVLAVKDLKKTFLFASINDPKSYEAIKDLKDGEETHIALGVGYDEMSKPVELDVITGIKGQLARPLSMGNEDNVKIFGQCRLVHVKNTKIDIIIANNRLALSGPVQYKYANVDWKKYDVTVIKVGYNYPMFVNNCKFWVMSLTDGATPQDTAHLKFKRIMRPMYPIDNI
jgi:microcystin degradation protein MlrC